MKHIRTISLTLVFTLVCLAPAPASAASACQEASSDRFARAEGELRDLYSAIREGLDEIPTRGFDVASRQRAIGEDPADLFAWVRDNTRWIAYRGVLRGARGTLMDRDGSHADRALLLAALLESAGHEVRLARSGLGEEAVDRLLDGLPSGASSADRNRGNPDTDAEDYARVADRLNADVETIRASVREVEQRAQALEQRVAEQVERQSRALHDRIAWAEPDDPERRDALRESIADHWWVQLRTGSGWQDLDPSLSSHAPGDRLADAAEQTLWPDEVPTEQHHRLKLEIVAERLDGGRLRENTALTHEIAAIDLVGRTIAVDLHPMDLPGAEGLFGGQGRDAPSTLPERLKSQDDWMPLITIGGTPEYDLRIRSDGRVVAMAATGQAELAEKASGMLGQISAGRGDSGPAPELTAVFLRLSILEPGADPTVHERALMDVLGPHRRAERELELEFNDALRARRAVEMLSSTEILAQAHWWPVDYTLGHLLHGALANRRATLGAVHAARRGNPGLMGKAIELLSASGIELVSLAHHRNARSRQDEAMVLTGLNLLSTTERMDFVDGQPAMTRGFDIIENRVDVRPGATLDARRARLDQGVLDTVLEAELIEDRGSARNTSLEFARALDAGAEWRSIDAADLPSTLDEDLAARVARTLAHGDTVVMAAEPAAGQNPSWWRVDPNTGTTLGIGPDGRGQMTEQILVLMNSIDNAVSAVATVQAVWNCILTRPSASGMQCCIVKTGLDIAAGNALGKLTDRFGEIASWAIDSKIYLAALDSVFGEANGIIVDGLMPDPCG